MLLLLNNEQVFRNTGMMNMSSAMTMTKSDNAQVGDTIVQHSFNITTVSVTSTDTALQKDLGRRELCHYNDTWTDKRTLLHSNNVNIQRTLRGAGCNPAAFTLLSSTDGGGRTSPTSAAHNRTATMLKSQDHLHWYSMYDYCTRAERMNFGTRWAVERCTERWRLVTRSRSMWSEGMMIVKPPR